MTTDQAQAVRPVPGWPHYVIGQDGLVRSLRFAPPKVIAHRKRGGYLSVTLHLNGVKRDKVVHRIMAEVWMPPSGPGEEVRHYDGDNFNNRLENLRWGTRSQNMEDAVRHGRNPSARKTHCIRNHEFTEDNTIWHGPDKRWRRCRTCDDMMKGIVR